MKINKKSLELVEKGISSKTVSKLTESQINVLHSKLINEQATSGVSTKTVTKPVTTVSDSALTAGVNVNVDGAQKKVKKVPGGIQIERELDEKKEDNSNPWAICTAQLGKEFGTTERSDWSESQLKKYERCVKDVKKSLKEGKNPVTLFFENKIMELLEKHLPAKISKKDLIRHITEQSPKEAPVKEPKTKPGTKEPPAKKPFNPGKNPNPKVNPAPKAKDAEQAKDVVIDTIMKILKNG